ncbi:MAG: glycosyltransferase family 4 protein [Alphaproteobacteria bacterium]|nr:glycosyltransferase family 4 protein [Alphaproteobacteria bacterium]
MQQRVLFLAQLPPPAHGVTTMSRRVLAMLRDMSGLEVEQHWFGSARTIEDIGRRDLRKVIGFGRLLVWLVGLWVSRTRVAFSYQTLAPHGDAAVRDLLLIAISKQVASRAIVHLHTRGLEEILAGGTWKTRLMRAALRGSELIAITQGVADAATASGVFSRVHWLPNLVDDTGGEGSRSGNRNELQCGFLGHVDPRKGVLRFVDAVRAMTDAGLDVRATMAGGPSRHLSLAGLRDYARDKGLEDRIDILGFVDEDQKLEMFRGLDLFIYPTEHDLSPLVVLEAMVMECVPIVYDTGGLREMMGAEFADHVIEPGSPDATARIVALAARYAADPATLAAAKLRARKRVLDHYSEAAYRVRLSAVIDAPLQAKRSRQAAASGALDSLVD